MEGTEDPERRQQGDNKFGTGPWTTDHPPITEFNGPTGDINYGELREGKIPTPTTNYTELQHHDTINSPSHYCNREMEAIEIIEMIIEIEHNPKVAYNMSNVLKYLLRFRDKGKAVHDLSKAVWYLNRMIDKIKEEESK